MSDEILSLFYPLSQTERDYMTGVKKPPTDKGDIVLSGDLFLRDGKLISIAPNFRFNSAPTHRHDYIEMAYVLHGRLTQTIEGKKIGMAEGDLLILNLNARHSVDICGADDIMVNFVILPEFFDHALKLSGMEDCPMRRFFINCIFAEDDRPDYLLFNVKDVLPIRNLIENLLWSLKNDIAYKQSTNRLTMALLLRLLQFHAGGVRSDEESTDVMWRVHQYVETRYADGSLADAAKTLGYDYRSLSREIVKKTGKTFTALIRERRLQQAVYYLKNTDRPVADVCAQIGYSNITYFYKAFVDRYGVTPGGMRSADREEDPTGS